MRKYFISSIKRLLSKFKIYVTRASIPSYFGAFGWKIAFGNTYKSSSLCIKTVTELFKRKDIKSGDLLLDIGCGDGFLAKNLSMKNIDLIFEGLDVGNSDQSQVFDGCFYSKKYFTSLIDFHPSNQYEVIVCSHFIEHQNNIEHTLLKIINLCKQGGYIILEWPAPHRLMIGGHVIYMIPSLLAYNFAKIGLNVTKSYALKSGEYYLLVIQKNIFKPVKDLIWDNGELEQLRDYLPANIYQGSDAYKLWNNLDFKIKI